MRIGIITFWWSDDNYGQLLQCWALQMQLRKMGHEPFLISYKIPESKPRKDSLIKKLIRYILIYPIIKGKKKEKEKLEKKKIVEKNNVLNKRRDFDNFRNKYIQRTRNLYESFNKLRKEPPLADAYICGSDQIWGLRLDREEYTSFFLNFGEKHVRRIAYAASFGTDKYPTKYNEVLKKLLYHFDGISCREMAGVRICNEVGVKATHVLDPTLLLSPNEYTFNNEKTYNGNGYIFIYSINIFQKEDIYWNDLKKFSINNNLAIVVTPSSGYTPARELFEGVDYIYATIPEWLSLIKNSSLVVTSSFHGIVFCILHHKSFIYTPVRGFWAKGNNRVLELLNELDLKSRIISQNFFYEKSLEPIDWTKVDSLLDIKRSQSIHFLQMHLK